MLFTFESMPFDITNKIEDSIIVNRKGVKVLKGILKNTNSYSNLCFGEGCLPPVNRFGYNNSYINNPIMSR